MATLNNADDQDQKQQPGAPLAVSGTAGASASGGQGVGVGGAAPQSPVAQNQAPQTNAGYTDVGTYLDANKSGSTQLGQQAAASLTNQYNSTRGEIDQSAAAAQDAASKGFVPDNSQLIQQVASNPSAAASDPGNVSAFRAQLNAQYTGPTSWADMGTLQGKANQAKQSADLINNPGGANVIAQQIEGPQASQGVNQLDAMLLRSPEAAQQVQAAADPFKSLNDYINQQNTKISSSIGDAQTAAGKARENAKTALQSATGNFNTQLQGKLTQAQTANDAYNKQIVDARSQLQSGTLPTGFDVDPALMKFLQGQVTPWYAASNAAVSPFTPNYLNALSSNTSPDAPDMASVASPQDYQTLAALSSLSGSPVASPLSQDSAAKAGTYKAPSTSGILDNKAIAGDISSALGATTGRPGTGQYDRMQMLEAALKNYQGEWTPQYGEEPSDPNKWGLWAYYHQGPGTALANSVGKIQ